MFGHPPLGHRIRQEEDEGTEEEMCKSGFAVGLMVHSLYYLWRKFRLLPLSDGAKAVLGLMQSDTTNNGIFIASTALADSRCRRACLYEDIEISTTHRIVVELEDKGLIAVEKKGTRLERAKLTYFGWRLNANARGTDKVA